MKSWVLDVKGEEGEFFIDLPQEFLQEHDWQPGDVISWLKQDDDSYVLKNLTREEKMSDLFVVETITVIKSSYAIMAKDGEHAADSVAMGEVVEFGKQRIDESIISVRRCNSEKEYYSLYSEYHGKNDSTDEDKQKFIHKINYE